MEFEKEKKTRKIIIKIPSRENCFKAIEKQEKNLLLLIKMIICLGNKNELFLKLFLFLVYLVLC
jgi:hypothetical protein